MITKLELTLIVLTATCITLFLDPFQIVRLSFNSGQNFVKFIIMTVLLGANYFILWFFCLSGMAKSATDARNNGPDNTSIRLMIISIICFAVSIIVPVVYKLI
jgi:hypothetical protein